MMTKLSKVAATLVVSALLFLGSAQTAEAACTVPNRFVNECSRYTGRCTGNRQVNGTFDGRCQSVYSTVWVWRWI